MKFFLTGKGIEAETIGAEKFPASDQMEAFFRALGTILPRLDMRSAAATGMYLLSTIKDMHQIVKESDRVLTF